MIRRALALWLLAAPVCALAESLPALYDVTGVAADDVLNVRRTPDAGSDIVGSLPPVQSGVEVVRVDDGATWGLVNVGEQSGWVSLAFLERQMGQIAGDVPVLRQCFGTEPFWSIRVADAALLFSTPDAGDKAGLVARVVRSQSRIDRFLFEGSFLGGEGADQEIAILVRREACDDGMSDRDFGFGAEVILNTSTDGKILLSGCCTLAPLAR